MNSDPYDSAAWRTFGILDADESAIFDEAMRHDPLLRGAYLEMDRLSAAIAAATTTPIEPKAGQLERLLARLSLSTSKRAYFWLGISGWAAAAVLALLLVLDRTGSGVGPANQAVADRVVSPPATAPAPSAKPLPGSVAPAPQPQKKTADTAIVAAPDATRQKDAKAYAKVETKRLVQEIQVLRENLEKFQHRDRVLFEAVPGMALPIVMRMNPPGLDEDDFPALARNDDDNAPITAMLGDALRVMTTSHAGALLEASDAAPLVDAALIPAHPTAIPIYDAARDAGTLVVSKLPPAGMGKVYNLWVTTATGAQPIYVGSLPESSASGADSFDFSLGSNMVLPSGFMLTKDPQDSPGNPTRTNTVLQGPTSRAN